MTAPLHTLASKPVLIEAVERALDEAARAEARAEAAECLAEAMANPSIVGVWGGTTENQRAKLRVTMPRQPKGIQHGTPGGHRTHRSRGEDSCGPCTAAARAQNTRYNERKNAKRRIERQSA